MLKTRMLQVIRVKFGEEGSTYKVSLRQGLTLKAPITTAADDKFRNFFLSFRQNYGMMFHENRLPADDSHEISCLRIVCQQRILMKYHALFVIFEKAVKFEIGVCCKL